MALDSVLAQQPERLTSLFLNPVWRVALLPRNLWYSREHTHRCVPGREHEGCVRRQVLCRCGVARGYRG